MVGARIVNKKKAKGLPVPKPLAFVLLLALVLTLSYLWLCGRCDEMARDVKKLELKGETLHRAVLTEEYKWTTMRSEKRIREALARFGIQMDWPANRAVIFLSAELDLEKPVIEWSAPSSRQFALTRDNAREVHD
jgi:hypothetical protein